jgi:uncharacterized membrane protein
MRGRLAYIRERLSTSVWLIPIGLCVLGAVLGLLMLSLDRYLGPEGTSLAPLAISLDSARQVLGVIASSIIGVGGVAFSITMVALTLTSGQYGPKILRSFLEDGLSKVTLGLFLGVYVYTLIVLAGYSQTDRPQLTVVVSLVLAFSALVAFVGFIHRTATDLQADNIIHRIGRQLQRTLRDLVAEDARSGRLEATRTWRRAARGHRPLAVASTAAGYVQTIDYGGLIAWCVTNDCVLQVRTRAGDFVVEGLCLFKIFGYNAEGTEDVVEQLNASIVVGPLRTPVEDPEYAITQLNQLAARALSPGINDPGTAITCVDWFTLGLSRIVDHDLPGCVFLDEDKRPRLLARGTSFQGILKAIYAPLRQFSKSDVAVTARLLESLYRLGTLTRRSGRLKALAQQAEQIWHQARRQPVSDEDIQDLHHRYIRLRSLLSVGHGSTQ